MRRQDHIAQTLQGTDEFLRIGGGLNREHIDGGTRKMLVPQRLRQRIKVYHGTARIVDETGAALHQPELALPDHVLGLCRLWHMHADDVAPRQEVIERGGRLRVAMPQLVGTVPVENAHPQGLGEHGELAADIAIADDAERLSAYLIAADGRLVPTALMR